MKHHIKYISIIFIIGLIIFLLIGYSTIKTTYYIMPDGTACSKLDISGTGFGAATQDFKWCDNNKIYINPAYYTTERRVSYVGVFVNE